MSVKAISLTAAVAASALGITALSAPPATAGGHHHRTWTRTLTTEVVAPFQLAYNHGSVYVADGGTSTVSRVTSSGQLKTVANGPQPGEVAGLDLSRSGTSIAYTWTDYASGKAGLTISTRHRSDVTADLSGYEETRNPDGSRMYGVPANTNQCAKDAIEQLSGGPASYPGVVESHPYAVAALPHDAWVVADAAGNDLLKVDSRGRVSTISVLPKQPLLITRGVAATLGLPDCAIGVTYDFEPVPTDVEVDQHGMLWVSTLPGGPEDPSLGARGSVYRVDPRTGSAQRVATGFLGATNLAVTNSGKVYVAELFAGRISTVSHGQAKPFTPLSNALSVEAHGGWLYAGTLADLDDEGNPTGPGTIVKIRR